MAQSYTLPSPYLGWRASDPLDQMPEGSAIRLENMIPVGTGAELRPGHIDWSTGLSSTVESLYSFNSQSGTSCLIGAAFNKFFNCTANGAATQIAALSITNNNWQMHNFSNRLIAVNGVDQPRQFELTGSACTIADATFTGIADDNKLNQGCLYRARQYFVDDQASVWYGGLYAVTGALVEFPLKTILHRGGKLLWNQSFSNNTGSVNQDLYVVCSAEGELLFYAGDYPGNNWAIEARKFIAKPIGRRSWFHAANDLWIITAGGIVSCTALLSNGPDIYVSTPIWRAYADLVKLYEATTGWQGMEYPNGDYALVNIPETTTKSSQIFINTKTNAYAKLTGQNARSWCIHDGELYFGGADGVVYKAHTGTDDNGATIHLDVKYAFSDFGDRRIGKHFIDATPYIESTSDTTVGLDIDVDFRNKAITNQVAIDGSSSGTAWGSAWGSPWGTTAEVNPAKVTLTGQGTFGALRLFADVIGTELKLSACQVRFEKEGKI
jgi:hypothetical protein